MGTLRWSVWEKHPKKKAKRRTRPNTKVIHTHIENPNGCYKYSIPIHSEEVVLRSSNKRKKRQETKGTPPTRTRPPTLPFHQPTTAILFLYFIFIRLHCPTLVTLSIVSRHPFRPSIEQNRANVHGLTFFYLLPTDHLPTQESTINP